MHRNCAKLLNMPPSYSVEQERIFQHRVSIGLGGGVFQVPQLKVLAATCKILNPKCVPESPEEHL